MQKHAECQINVFNPVNLLRQTEFDHLFEHERYGSGSVYILVRLEHLLKVRLVSLAVLKQRSSVDC